MRLLHADAMLAHTQPARVNDAYPPMASGERVPFKPSDRPRGTAAGWERILSKHRHTSSAHGKSSFPADWSDDDIKFGIDATLAAPDPNGIRRSGDKITFEREVSGVLIRVHVRVDVTPPILWTAYPPESRLEP